MTSLRCFLGLSIFAQAANAMPLSRCEWEAALKTLRIPHAQIQPRLSWESHGSVPLLSFENGHGVRDRTIHIPANVLVQAYTGDADAWLMVVAQNTFMDGSYHNIAAHAAEHLLRRHDPARFEMAPHREWTEITYDDETPRSGNLDFYSRLGEERSPSGEFLQLSISTPSGARTLYVVKAIGDYNEVGDFAVPIATLLGIPASRIIALRDDLKTARGTVTAVSAKNDIGVKHDGNNMLRSMNRNLLIGFSQVMRERILSNPLLAGALPIEDYRMIQFFSSLEATILQRQGGLSNAGAVETFLQDRFWKVTVEQFFPGRLALLKAGAKRAADLDALYGQRDLESAFNELNEQLKKALHSRLAYNQVLLGTSQPAESSASTTLYDYVLSPFPTEVYDETFFDGAIASIQQLLR